MMGVRAFFDARSGRISQMKPFLIPFAAGCVAALAVALSSAPARAQCEPLKSRLDQAKALEEIHRRNATNRRDLHNKVHQEWEGSKDFILREQAKCDEHGPGSFSCSMLSRYKAMGLDPDVIRKRLDRIQADLDEVTGKLQATIGEKKFVSGELEKCNQKEAATAAARKKASQEAARTRSKARARQRAAEQRRRDADEAARAAAAAAAVGAIIGTMGRSGVSRGRPPRNSTGACPPGMRRSADNPNCHYPRGRR